MKSIHMFCFSALIIFLQGFTACHSAKRSDVTIVQHDADSSEKTYALRDINIIPMTPDNKVVEHASVIIKGEKIMAINAPVPADAIVIDAKGKWLIPGLIDMHVHSLADVGFGPTYPTKGANIFTNTRDFMMLYVANGVTTALELSGRVEHFGQRNAIIKREAIGPRIALAMLIEGGEGSGNRANTPADGRQTVRIAKAQGYEFIKVYSRLNIDTYKAIVDEAAKQGMQVVGHIPNAFKGRTEEAFVPNFAMVAHAEEYAKQADTFTNEEAKRFADMALKNKTWLTPTLITMVRISEQAQSLDSVRNLPYLPYVHPLMQSKWLTSNNYNKGSTPERVTYFRKVVAFNNQLVKAFKDAGVPIVAGTDAGTSGVVWGFALHDELDLLVKAGLTTSEALASATRLPADWLGLGEKIGTVEVGKLADLILLDENPLNDINNTRKIAGVFFNGHWMSRKTIDALLDDLAKRNNANKDKYDWKKVTAF